MTAEEFLGARLKARQAEMNSVILNRVRWDKVRDECRMLTFLQERAGAADFRGLREELTRINDGAIRVPGVDGPRGKATDCLRLWAEDLQLLD